MTEDEAQQLEGLIRQVRAGLEAANDEAGRLQHREALACLEGTQADRPEIITDAQVSAFMALAMDRPWPHAPEGTGAAP